MLSIFTNLYIHDNFSGIEMSLENEKSGLFYIPLLTETYNKVCIQFKTHLYTLYLSIYDPDRQ